ncbi:MAG TPA: hypothetical protein VGL81_17870 [Polyangiaceae bacterium]
MDAAEPPTQVVVIDESSPARTSQSARVEAPELELGVGSFLMSGGGTGGYLGVSPFLVDELGETWSLRPSLVLGASVPGDPRSMLGAARVDLCFRLPGNYEHGSGVQLDVCGGVDGGASHVAAAGQPVVASQLIPYVDVGPSVGVRAEVGRLAVLLRGVGGIDLTRGTYRDATGAETSGTGAMLRLELAFAWMVHHGEPR